MHAPIPKLAQRPPHLNLAPLSTTPALEKPVNKNLLVPPTTPSRADSSSVASNKTIEFSKTPTIIPDHRPTTPDVHSHGMRAALHHAFPRHSLFHVRVNLHQISSVPLVHGEFGVRWKFKHVQAMQAPKSGKVKGKKEGKGKRPMTADSARDEESPGTPERTSVETGTINSRGDSTSGSRSFSGGTISSKYSDSLSLEEASMPRTVSMDQMPSTATTIKAVLRDTAVASEGQLPSTAGTIKPTPLSASSLKETTEEYATAKGQTRWVKLKDHSVTWEHTLDLVVKMDVERDTLDLLPLEMKLVVMQRVIAGDPDAPHNPRLGAVYINLAEYASAGLITRRYLLRESKTNATLRLTIQLENVGGEKEFKAPPLPKSEVFGGVTGLLESDVYKTRPRALDLHAFYDDNPNTLKPNGKAKKPSPVARSSSFLNWGGSSADAPFDVSTLALNHGPKTTEAMIEALFNPIGTSAMKQTPFTYYVPPGSRRRKPSVVGAEVPMNGNAAKEGDHLAGSEAHSVYSEASSNSEDTSHHSIPSLSSSEHSHQRQSSSSGGFTLLNAETKPIPADRVVLQAGMVKAGMDGYGGGRVEPWWRKLSMSKPGYGHKLNRPATPANEG